MDILAEKENAELQFWREWMQKPDYQSIRAADFLDKTRWFDGYLTWEEGPGLDLACGPDSVFEHYPAPINVTAVDRLLDRYPMSPLRKRIRYQTEDAENLSFPSGSFKWVFCINMIDHTPNPERVISEIQRVLVPKGKLFFEVHFDPGLYAPHYTLWNMVTVQQYLGGFKCLRGVLEWKPEWSKYIYWGVYQRT